MKRIFWSLLTVCMLAAVMTVGTFAADASETFITAVEEANTNNGTVTLTENVILGEKLTITGNVTIVGEYTITRAEQYTGTLFAVNKDASLTLDGGVTIDGGNEWVMNHELYAEDIADWENAIPKTDSQKWFTPEENAPVATAYMITTSGTVNLNNVTVKN
ncbi:MAG: hypothetical protein IJX14_05495, partial [Clostridia bacterium]|nr:hypothetical protein [Clostridia bacterium]